MTAHSQLVALTADQEQLVGEARAYMEQGAHAMIEVGKRLCVLKAAIPHGQFIAIVQDRIGVNPSSARRMMAAAIKLADVERYQALIELPKTKVLELMRIDRDDLEHISLGGRLDELCLDTIRTMTVHQLRAAVGAYLSRNDLLLEGKYAEIDALCLEGRRSSIALNVGDRIQSIHAKRPGRVVKVYPDGSACVCWDDGEPQPEGMGHERMPRDLLELVEQAAPAADAAGGRGVGRAAVNAILNRLIANPPSSGATDQDTVPDEMPAQVTPENVICMQAARLRSGTTPDTGKAERDPARMRAYCTELLPLLMAHASPAELVTLTMILEDMITDQTLDRPEPQLVAAHYDLYCRFWLEGGAK